MDGVVLCSEIRHRSLPEKYVRPESERPKLSEISDCEDVPVIDLGSDDKSQINQKIGDACRLFGFFQVINHGVSADAVEEMMKVAEEFFKLPVEEKMKFYSEDPSKTMRLSTSFNVTKEAVHNWRDYLRLHCWPVEQFVPEWPPKPSSLRRILLVKTRGLHILLTISLRVAYCGCWKAVSRYVKEVRGLGLRLEEAIAESLGLGRDFIKDTLREQGQHMAINYYPPCPEPELTYGLPGHTDPNALTILLQDSHVCGLQVLIKGRWVSVKPYPNAFVINIGDQLQALSNGIYKSVWHRAVVNADKPRISVASFLCPADEAVISAPPDLTADGSAAVYRSFTYPEYYRKFWGRNLDQEHCLELFKN